MTSLRYKLTLINLLYLNQWWFSESHLVLCCWTQLFLDLIACSLSTFRRITIVPNRPLNMGRNTWRWNLGQLLMGQLLPQELFIKKNYLNQIQQMEIAVHYRGRLKEPEIWQQANQLLLPKAEVRWCMAEGEHSIPIQGFQRASRARLFCEEQTQIRHGIWKVPDSLISGCHGPPPAEIFCHLVALQDLLVKIAS